MPRLAILQLLFVWQACPLEAEGQSKDVELESVLVSVTWCRKWEGNRDERQVILTSTVFVVANGIYLHSRDFPWDEPKDLGYVIDEHKSSLKSNVHTN
jgi:hypothetical protein